MKTNEQGFSLISLLICMAILSIVMMGTAEALNQAILTSQTTDAKISVSSLTASIAGQALNQAICTAAITKNPTILGQPLQFDRLQAGRALPDYNLVVQSVQFTDSNIVATGYDGTKIYYGNLTLTLSSIKKILGGQGFAPRTVAAIYLKVSPEGQLLECGPTLPTLPLAPMPPTDSKNVPSDPDAARGCASINGVYSGGVCTIDHSHDNDNNDEDTHNGCRD